MNGPQGSVDIETMGISDVTESHENQRNSSSNLEKSRKKLSEVLGQLETTSFSSEKIQTIVDECIKRRVSPFVLALKYNVCVSTIKDWIKKSGRSLKLGRFLVDMNNFKSMDDYKDISTDNLGEIFNGLTKNVRQIIIEDCTEKLISPSVLALKYKVDPKTIRDLVIIAGKKLSHRYVVNLANYSRKMPWLLPIAKQEKIKAILDECIEKEISPSVLALIHNSVKVKDIYAWALSYDRILPANYKIDLSNYKSKCPDLPERLQDNEGTDAIEAEVPVPEEPILDSRRLDSTVKGNFENDIPLLAIHSVRKDGDMIKLNSPGLSTNSLNPTLVATGGVSVPQTRKRWARDFTEDEKAAIVDECTVELYSPTLLAEKYNIEVLTIRQWVKAAGKFLPWKYRYNATTQLTKQPDLRTLSSDLSIGN